MTNHLIVGLGNPGKPYEATRHNVGFMIVDKLAQMVSATWQAESKWHCIISRTQIGDRQLILVKPQTFMNESGVSVQALVHYYKIPAGQTYVICDDLDQPFGRLRVRYDGSAGGHNGLKSVISHIGSAFWRYRFGIGQNERHVQASENYVLDNFTKDQSEVLPLKVSMAATIILRDIETEMPQDTTHDLLTS